MKKPEKHQIPQLILSILFLVLGISLIINERIWVNIIGLCMLCISFCWAIASDIKDLEKRLKKLEERRK